VVFQIIFFLFTSSVAFQSSDESSVAARELYQQAEQALISDQPEQALPALRALVTHYPATEYALPAVVRLAELELAGANPLPVVALIAEWMPKSSTSEQTPGPLNLSGAQDTTPGLPEGVDEVSRFRLQQLLVTALARLSKQQFENLAQQWLLLDRSVLNGGESIVVRELAKRAAKSGDESTALLLLEKLGSNASDRDMELRDFFLPLAILRNNPTAENIEMVRLKAVGLPAGVLDRRTSLTMAVAEAYRKQGNLRLAKQVLDALAVELVAVAGQSAERNGAELADSLNMPEQLGDWRASIDLRRAEILIANGEHRAAAELLNEAVEEYPQFSLKSEFHFLLARCMIAEINFDQALAELEAILEHAEHSSEVSARALWMMGEIELMKRQYDSAIGYYSQVACLSNQPQWQARSLLQMGKCRELQSKNAEAQELYEKIASQFASSEVSQIALHRLAQLKDMKIRSSSPKPVVQAKDRQGKTPGSGPAH